MKKLLIGIVGLSILLQGCNVGASGSWKDENIQQSLKQEIRQLDETVIKSIITNDVELFKSLMSSKLLEQSGRNISNLVTQANSVIRSNNYEILHQFHVKNSSTGIGNTVMSGVGGEHDFVIRYQALNHDMFISLVVPESSHDHVLVTNIYGKYPEGWKLNIVQFGQYTVDGKTATELYSDAIKLYEQGYLMDAANSMFLSSQVTNPANQFWAYKNEEKMKNFYEKVIFELKSTYSFPIELDEISTKPEILNVYPQRIDEGYFPMVEYLTNIELSDTVKTKQENEQIQATIGQIFKGLDKNKKYVFYKAFAERPNGKTPVQTYGFIQNIE